MLFECYSGNLCAKLYVFNLYKVQHIPILYSLELRITQDLEVQNLLKVFNKIHKSYQEIHKGLTKIWDTKYDHIILNTLLAQIHEKKL